MRLTLSGTRGSVGRAGTETAGYGGDTSCVLVEADDGTPLVLDGGSGIVRLNQVFSGGTERVDILLTHLHMDHIQGLGFFQPLFRPDVEVFLYGPVSSTMGLAERLGRYLSPPLFPVRLRDLPNVHIVDLRPGSIEIGPFRVNADLICHPGPTLGYRVTDNGRAIAYLPDHEPALALQPFPGDPRWTSGYELAEGVDALVHDFQYTEHEYGERRGWGHSSQTDAIAFAELVGAGRLVTFHHDPEHDDDLLDRLHREAVEQSELPILAGKAGSTVDV